MPHKIKLAPARYTGPKPQNPGEGRLLLAAVVTAVISIVVVITIIYFSQSVAQRSREAHWQSGRGVVEQVRPILVGQWQGGQVGQMLYSAQVLARYTDAQGRQERWVTVRQTPRTLQEIQFEASHWMGASCIVRWNPANTNEIDVEIS